MPRRRSPDPDAEAIGRRIRKLRQEAGLTLEKLAFESDAPRGREFSKGHLSSLERGLVMPTVATLKVLAARLGVLVADLVNDPDENDRAKLLELTRSLSSGSLRRLVRDATPSSPKAAKKASRPQ